MLTDAEITEALRLLNLTAADLSALRSGQLDELKLKAKKHYKKAATSLHPDVNGGDAEKSAAFVLLSTFMREFLGMQPPLISCRKTVKRRITVKVRSKSRRRAGVNHADG